MGLRFPGAQASDGLPEQGLSPQAAGSWTGTVWEAINHLGSPPAPPSGEHASLLPALPATRPCGSWALGSLAFPLVEAMLAMPLAAPLRPGQRLRPVLPPRAGGRRPGPDSVLVVLCGPSLGSAFSGPLALESLRL